MERQEGPMREDECLQFGCGRFIREKREDAGLSQQKLADLIGVVKNTVYNWENERSRIRIGSSEVVDELIENLHLNAEEEYLFRKCCLRQDVPRPPQTLYVPRIPPGYVKREIEEEIAKRLRMDHVVLHGMGGIGKTSIAIAVARSHAVARRFGKVVWLDCDEVRRKREDWKEKLCEMFLPMDRHSVSVCWERLLRELDTSHERVLVVLDDVTPAMDISPVMELARRRTVSLLATTQYPDSVTFGLREASSREIAMMRVEGVSPEQGIAIVEERHPGLDVGKRHALREIGELVRWHTGTLRYVAFEEPDEWEGIREELREGNLPDKVERFVRRQIERAVGDERKAVEGLMMITRYGRFVDSFSMAAVMGGKLKSAERKLKALEKTGIVRDLGVYEKETIGGVHVWEVESLAYGVMREMDATGGWIAEKPGYRWTAFRLAPALTGIREVKRMLKVPVAFRLACVPLIVGFTFAVLPLYLLALLPVAGRRARGWIKWAERRTVALSWSVPFGAYFLDKGMGVPAVLELLQTISVAHGYVVIAGIVVVLSVPWVASILGMSVSPGLAFFLLAAVIYLLWHGFGKFSEPVWIAYRLGVDTLDLRLLRKLFGDGRPRKERATEKQE